MPNETLTTLLNKCITRFPNNIAVQYLNKNEELSFKYSDIHSYSETISQVLLSLKSPELLEKNYYIGICFNVNYVLPIVICGILKAGLAFVPLDHMNGTVWNKNIIERLKIKFIFTNRKCTFLQNTQLLRSFKISYENIELRSTSVEDEIKPPFVPMAYSVQTSGTTGSPKIIKVPHSAIIPNIIDLSSLFEVTPEDVIFLSSPPTFDPSVIELFLALSNGATLLIVDEDVKKDPQGLLDALFPQPKGRVTILQTTPSVFQKWSTDILSSRVFSQTSNLRILAFGGEKCPSLKRMVAWAVSENTTIYNLYGISEVSCWAAVMKIPYSVSSNESTVKPSNEEELNPLVISDEECTQCFSEPMSQTVLQLRNTDENNIGEMFIGSDIRTCIIDNENPGTLIGSTVFRPTGDLFKEVSGKYYFLSRKKDEVKRFGVKLSLKSIEALAEDYASVSRAVCLSYNSEQSSGLLGLFIVPHENEGFRLAEFKKALKDRCPQGAWPDIIKDMAIIPVTQHGKTDEKYLIKLMLEESNLTDGIKLFECLWVRYSLCTDINKDEGFISSGGTSFSAVQLMAELQKQLNLEYKFILNLLQDVKFDTCIEQLNNQDVYADSSKHIDGDSVKKRKLDNESLEVPKDDISKYNDISMGDCREISAFIPHNLINSTVCLKINWKYCLGKCVDASPKCETIEGNTYVVVGSHSGRVAVLDVNSGNIVAQIVLPDRVESSACIDGANKRFAIGCYDFYIYMYTLDGHFIWSYRTNDIVKCSPCIINSNVICGSYDKHVYCLNAESGKLQWKRLVGGQVLTKPLFNDSTVIYIATLSSSVYALDIDTGDVVCSLNLGYPIFSNFLISEDNLIVADVQGTVHWISSGTGQEVLTFKASGNIFSSLVEDDGFILFGTTEGWLHRINIRDATLVWKIELDSRLVSAPLVFEAGLNIDCQKTGRVGTTVSCQKQPVILIVSSSGCVYIVHPLTGTQLASLKLPGEVFSSPAVHSDSILIGCRDNHLYSVQVSNKPSL